MKRLVLTLSFFLVLSLGVGLLLSGDDYFEWGVAAGLFGIAVAGEALRFWLKRGRARKRESSGI